jgi:hypothetical protein
LRTKVVGVVLVGLVLLLWWGTLPSAQGWWRQYVIDARTEGCEKGHAEATNAELAGCIICTRERAEVAEAEVARLRRLLMQGEAKR